ncbi:MAG: RloB family protein [Paramuribaculum sp.]|nr:RloB family protein [Paramuribaculum sp.]
MDIEHLGYTKPEPFGDIILSNNKEDTAQSHSEDAVPSDISTSTTLNEAGYSKPDIEIETVCMFLVSGGEKRERDYIKYLESNASRRLRVVFISKKGQGLTPTQMLKEVEESIEEECFQDYYGHLSYLSNEDIIYLISDVDQYGEDLKRHLGNSNHRYKWIISNPAFEVWLYYHFYDTPTFIEEAANIPIAQRSQWLKDKLHKLRESEGGVNASEALKLVEIAVKNSKMNYNENEDKLPSLFSTQMHIVAEHILNLLDDDFYKMLKDRDSIAKEFISKTK